MEQQLNDLKRENKRIKDKLVSVSEAKRKSSEENAQTQTLLQSYKDANARLFEERQGNQTLQSQLDAMNVNFKKLQTQYLQVKEEHDQLKKMRKEEDKLRRFPVAKPEVSMESRRERMMVSVPRNTADVPKPSSIKPFQPSTNLRNPFGQGASPPSNPGSAFLLSQRTVPRTKESVISPSKAPFNLSAKKSIKL